MNPLETFASDGKEFRTIPGAYDPCVGFKNFLEM